ncbi:MAG: prenyltransferase [Anaerolineaceae bacterium]|nr:prenyltransferase [Anaerolineaceae bacterium]
MNQPQETLFKSILHAAHPLSLIAGILLYALGGGIATYLGESINWPVYWIGQGAVTLLQLSSYFLREYFDRAGQPPFEIRTGAPPGNGDKKQPVPPPRVIFLQVALTSMTAGAVLTVLLLAAGRMSPVAFLFIGLAFILAIVYAIPPFRLVYSGYGELILSILITNLFPAFAYILQVGELHRLLAMLTFPLTFLYLAAILAQSLSTYLEDIKQNRQTMLARLGWQRGMSLHNILIAGAYILLAFSVLAGLPWRLAFPAFWRSRWVFFKSGKSTASPVATNHAGDCLD